VRFFPVAGFLRHFFDQLLHPPDPFRQFFKILKVLPDGLPGLLFEGLFKLKTPHSLDMGPVSVSG
jgi:hypothetical protein